MNTKYQISNTKTHQRCIDFCTKSKSENKNLNFINTNRCAVWMTFSKNEESALVPYLVLAWNMGKRNSSINSEINDLPEEEDESTMMVLGVSVSHSVSRAAEFSDS